MRLILDANSFLNQALLRGTDHDNGRVVRDEAGKDHQVNSAQYGVDGFWDKFSKALEYFGAAPRQCVLVWDGKNAKLRRQTFLPTYKAGRDKLPEVSAQLNLARDTVTQMAKHLGILVVYQDGLEADDVIGYLCKHLRNQRNTVISADGDLAVLVDENTDVWNGSDLNKNPFGPFPHKHITTYKALVGDVSDKIPGAKGFGDAAFVNFVRTWGLEGLDEMARMIQEGKLEELADSVSDLPALKKVLEGKDMVATSWRCASLMIEEVNTMRRPLTVEAGLVAQWAELDDSLRAYELKQFYGTKTLVSATNFDAAYKRFRAAVVDSPFVALDIETSSSEESDEWLEQLKAISDTDRIDVLGHELTGMSLTFGSNTQHTIYMTVDHAGSDNITVDQCRTMVEAIPHEKMHTVIQNRQFELSVLYRTWGHIWADNGWRGMVPNAIDTKVGASYVNENLKKGLKERSWAHLGYKQTTYQETTQLSGPATTNEDDAAHLPPGGRQVKLWEKVLVEAVYAEKEVPTVDEETGEITGSHFVNGDLLQPEVKEWWETREYKMNELPAAHVFDYGCDDTICTAGLHTYYQFMMELEGTWDIYLAVETLPEYLTSLAFVEGIPISLERLRELETKDDESYEQAWATLRAYLMKKGWAGTICPEFEGDIEPSDAKLAVDILVSEEFTTKKRKLNAIAFDLRTQFPDNDTAELLAVIIERNDVAGLNRVIRDNFTGEPKINFGSPKQMQALFYETIGIKPRIFNKLTDKQRDQDDFRNAFKKMRQAKEGKTVEYTAEERVCLISKASTDDTAVDSALALDQDLSDEIRAVLKAYKIVKEVQTRRNLFYKTYKAIPHWRDGRIHPSLNQSEAVTRRYSSSGPNIQQLPSKGEGAAFREVLLPHHKDAIVVSLDFSGQELRLGAELSGDEAMTSCYVGDNLRDMHSLTAVAAAVTMWGKVVSYEEFQDMRKSEDVVLSKKAKKLRDDAKTVNFASQYGAMAAKIAETMMCEEEVAQTFLDARAEAFPGIIEWDKRVQEEAKDCGFSRTMMGARRHLREALTNENKWERAKAERQVGNFWIQSSASEMTKLAMVRVWERLICSGEYDAKFYCPIHDELVFSVHRGQAVEFIQKAHACMVAQYSTMKIPLESSIAIGRNFGCDIEVGSDPYSKALPDAISKLFA